MALRPPPSAHACLSSPSPLMLYFKPLRVLCMASLKQLKTQFLEYTEIEKGRSLHTVENYDRYLTRFLNFLKNDNPANITDTSVREFRLWLNRQSNLPWKSLVGKSGLQKGNSDKTLSKNTQNYYLIALRAFLKYLMLAFRKLHQNYNKEF
jgi:site-specific recombinase XerD